MTHSIVAAVLLTIIGVVLCAMAIWLHRTARIDEYRQASSIYALFHDEVSGPLQGMLATLANLQQSTSGDLSAWKDELEGVNNCALRLVDVTRNLQLLAKLDTPGVNVLRERVDVVGIVQQVIVDYADLAQHNNVRLVYDGVDGAVYVLGNSVDLTRVFSNLISNAIKYRRDDVDESNVLVNIQPLKRSALISVEDNGMGMSHSQIETLGDAPQPRTAHTIGKKGSGLGLLLVKKIVQTYRGNIQFDSEKNSGTTITIQLPTIQKSRRKHSGFIRKY